MLNRFVRPAVSTLFKLSLEGVVPRVQNQHLNFLSVSSRLRTMRATITQYHFSEQKPEQPSEPSQQFKDQSKEFYENYVDNIIELKKSEDWQLVIQNTPEPLIIDFYADWCGPCKKLTPILEQRINDSKGKFKLLKVNIDKCGELAQHLKITSVPTVFAVFRGQAVDTFKGVPQNERLEQLFETLEKIISISSVQDQAIEVLTEAKEHMNTKQFEEAEELLYKMPTKGIHEEIVAIKEIFLSQCLLSNKKIAKFKEQLKIIKGYEKYYTQNPELVDFYHIIVTEGQKIEEMTNNIPEVSELQAKVSEDPKDLESRFRLAEVYREKQMLEESLETLLQIMKLDKSWEDKKANKMMLEIFKELGNSSPATQKYRKLMQRVLH